MRKLIRGILVLGLLAGVAAPAAAQVRMQLLSGAPYGAVTGWGAYVGPYRGAMISEPGSPQIDVFCVDYLNGVSINQQWDANFRSLAGDLTGTRFGEAARLKYIQAAWLSSQFALQPQSSWKNIHAAIWLTMTCPSCQPAAATGNVDVQAWMAKAQDANNFSKVNLAEWSVVTDVRTIGGTTDQQGNIVVGTGGVQEYLTRTVVPEPGTLLLFGTGLLLIGLVAWRRQLT